MSKVAIISDLHLTENPYDEYRWEIWPWIRNTDVTGHIAEFFILGDLLDKKDRHPAELVNRLVDEIAKTARILPVTILKGNHDYYKPEHPFIKFVEWIDNVMFIDKPTKWETQLWLPHSKNPEEEWKDINFKDPKLKYIFMHQSVIGSQVSNYHEMKTGLSTKMFRGTPAKIFSGDIHVPQDIAIADAQPLTYIGTQYPIAFGDTYKPRGLILDLGTGKTKDIHLKTIQKLHLKLTKPEDLAKYEYYEGDQIKVTLQLTSAELSDWPKYKKEIQVVLESEGCILRDIKLEKLSEDTPIKDKNSQMAMQQESPNEIINRYATIEKLDKRILEAGLDLLKDTHENTSASRFPQHTNPVTQRQQRTKL